jgi:hypothetical protein
MSIKDNLNGLSEGDLSFRFEVNEWIDVDFVREFEIASFDRFFISKPS